MRDPSFWWRKPGAAAAALAPLAAAYAAVAQTRLNRIGERATVPVICIGNPTVGGAGKTPPPWVIDRLQFKEDGAGYLDRRRDHLWLLDLGDGAAPGEPAKPVQLTFGDYDDHQKLATRIGVHYTHSLEEKQSQPGTEGIENSQIRLTDGSVIFTPDLFGPGITVNEVDYQMSSIDGGLKYKGLSLEGELAKQKVFTWPDLVYSEFICLIAFTAALVIWSILIEAPLEEPAATARTPNPSKAPWYFLGLQELLVYFDPWIAGVLLPGYIIVGLMAIPYLDTNPKGNGYYTFEERPFVVMNDQAFVELGTVE